MKRLLFIFSLLTAMSVGGVCGQNIPELPLPNVPAELRAPAERAAYVIDHYWDGMRWNDPSMARSREFLEQNLVNWLSLFPFVDSGVYAPAVGRVLHMAEADKECYLLLTEIAEQYLDETDSPMRDEEYYIPFLEAQLNSPILDRYEKMRPQYRLTAAMKNRRGEIAADFTYSTPDGVRHTLHKSALGERLLLFFYDPECDHCKDVMATLNGDAGFAAKVRSGRLKVLIVSPDGDKNKWRESLSSLPEGWVAGLDETGVRRREAYMLRTLPALYLLDGEMHVVMKEPRIDQLLENLN